MYMVKKIATCILLLSACSALHAQNGPQLYNMDFDTWYKKGGEWRLCAKDDPESKQIWGTANKGLSLLGVNATMPESEFVAVEGPGKKACKMRSMKVLWAFAAGNLFNGKFLRLEGTSGAAINYGAPFTARPAALEGYYCYLPQTINYVKAPYLDKKGTLDIGRVEVILADWDEPFEISTTKDTFVDIENDPHIIGYAAINLTETNDGYIHFTLPIEYRSGRSPKYAVIVATSSTYGGYFTGGNGSTLYIDEFSFKY